MIGLIDVKKFYNKVIRQLNYSKIQKLRTRKIVSLQFIMFTIYKY